MSKLKVTLILALVLVIIAKPTYAQTIDSRTGFDYCDISESDLINQTSWAPGPLQIICPVLKILNVLTLAAGAVFTLMIFFGAYKYALAQGDPKALEGAKGTLTHALLGFIVVVGMYLFLVFIQRAFSLDDNLVLNPFLRLSDAINRLLGEEWANLEN